MGVDVFEMNDYGLKEEPVWDRRYGRVRLVTSAATNKNQPKRSAEQGPRSIRLRLFALLVTVQCVLILFFAAAVGEFHGLGLMLNGAVLLALHV